MKNFIVLSTMLIISISAFAKAKTQVCYGDEGVDVTAPYILTVNSIALTQIDLITEEFLNSSMVDVVNVISLEPSAFYVLSVRPQTPVSNDVLASNKKIDRAVRRSVAALMKRYKITASGYALECNGTVTGLPRAGGMN